MLLVLDNFEHLLSAAPDVGRLVCALPGRSRCWSPAVRRCGSGASTSTPWRRSRCRRGEVDHAEALAASRVRRPGARPRARRFAPPLTEQTTSGRSVELCQRLAGLPLAIELATAQLRLLPPQSLLDRLDEHRRVRRPRPARAAAHHARHARLELRPAVAPSSRRCSRLLGVFRGGATLEAIEEVAPPAGASRAPSVLELLEQLVEHSLVVVRTGPDGCAPLRHARAGRAVRPQPARRRRGRPSRTRARAGLPRPGRAGRGRLRARRPGARGWPGPRRTRPTSWSRSTLTRQRRRRDRRPDHLGDVAVLVAARPADGRAPARRAVPDRRPAAAAARPGST